MISVVIPTYNEKENIVNLIKEIEKNLKKVKLSYEIIIVDDNSTDGTNQLVKLKFINDKNVRLFVRKNNRELGTAILHGIKKSKGSVILGMDADFNHSPSEIVNLVNNLKNYQLVVASRYKRGGGMQDKVKYITSYMFNWLLKNILNFPIMDNTSGFYAIKKSDLLSLPFNYIYRGYGEYHLKLVYLANKHGLKIKEIPVYFPKRRFGLSKSNTFKMFFSYLWKSLKIRFQKS